MSGCAGQSGFHCTGIELCALPFEERFDAVQSESPSVRIVQRVASDLHLGKRFGGVSVLRSSTGGWHGTNFRCSSYWRWYRGISGGCEAWAIRAHRCDPGGTRADRWPHLDRARLQIRRASGIRSRIHTRNASRDLATFAEPQSGNYGSGRQLLVQGWTIGPV